MNKKKHNGAAAGSFQVTISNCEFVRDLVESLNAERTLIKDNSQKVDQHPQVQMVQQVLKCAAVLLLPISDVPAAEYAIIACIGELY